MLRAFKPQTGKSWTLTAWRFRAIALLCLSSAVSAQISAAEVLVAHPGVERSALTQDLARSLYTLRTQQWQDGQSVRVFVLVDNAPSHRGFVKQVLGLFPRQLRAVWDRNTFSGTGQAPRQVESLAAMRDRVATTPGAIGYLPAEWVDESVKVIEVLKR